MAALTPEQVDTLNRLLTTINEQLPNILTKLSETSAAASDSASSASTIAQKLLEGKDAAATAADAATASLGVYQAIATNSETYAEQIKAIASALELITKQLKAQREAIPAGITAEITNLQRTLQLRKQNLQAARDTTRAVGETETVTRRFANLEREVVRSIPAGGPTVRPPKIKPKPTPTPRPRPKPDRRRRPRDGGDGGHPGVLGSVAGVIGDVAMSAGPRLVQLLSNATTEMERLYTTQSGLSAGLVKYTGLVMNADTMVRRNIMGQRTMAETMIQTQERMAALGVSITDVRDGYKNLITNSYAFRTQMTKNTQESRRHLDNVARLVIGYDKMGLASTDFGKTLDVLSKTYGRTNIVKDTREFGEELMHIARTTGQIPTQIAKDFTTFMSGIGSAYSFDKAQKIFRNLSLTSAETGVAMSKMLEGVKKFDDLDTAAEAVGELNAMLGGPYLNTLDMVSAEEDDRIKMLQGAAKASGVNFDALKKFGRLSIGEKMGFDPQDAMRLMRTRSGAEKADSERRRKMLAGDALSYDQLTGGLEEGAVRNAVSIEDSFKAAKQGLYLVEGAYTQVETAATGMAGMLRKLGIQTSDFIEQTVLGMVQTLSSGIDTAGGLMEDREPIAALATLFLTTQLYKVKELARIVKDLGLEGSAEVLLNTGGGVVGAGVTPDLGGTTVPTTPPPGPGTTPLPTVENTEGRTDIYNRLRGALGGSALVTAPIQIYLGNELLDESQRTVVANWIAENMPSGP